MIRLIVFDLDLTLWHCGTALWCDQLTPPLHLSETGKIQSGCGSHAGLFPDVPSIIEELSSAGYELAIASRTDAPDIANELLDRLNIAHHFPHPLRQIYPGDKTSHFHTLLKKTGLAFSEMVFFDDEPRNIDSVSRLGVSSHLVNNGMSRSDLGMAIPNEREFPSPSPTDRRPGSGAAEKQFQQ